MNSSLSHDTAESQSELLEFVAWLLVSIGCECQHEGSSAIYAIVPESLREPLECGETLRMNFADDDALTIESPIIRRLVTELKSQKMIGRAVPECQPESVREVSQRLFEQYTIDNGSVHLGGCTLEDRAILRVSYLERGNKAVDSVQLRHRFVNLAGEAIDSSLVERLRLSELVPPSKTIRVTEDQADRWNHVGDSVVEKLAAESNCEPLLTTVVWCKRAEGKLAFVIGDATESVAFSDWAQSFVDGTTQAPPLCCSSCAKGSHHVAATDAGQIVPFEAISTCSVSGKRVLDNDLETCPATGSRALPEYFTTCPASGKRVLKKSLVACKTCAQAVSPLALDDAQCTACRSLTKVSKDDPRMARLLGEYPNLDRWSSWKLAETADAYVVVATAIAKRLLLVIDKTDLGIRRMAKGSRFSKKWSEVSAVDRTAYLG